MTEASEVIKFIDQTLADMTARPGFWGPLPAVELQILRLLEIRLLLVDPRAQARDASELARSYWDALARDFPSTDAVSLRTRVNGDIDAFSRWLTKFSTEQQRAQDQRANRPRIISLRPRPRSSVPPPRPYVAEAPASDQPVSPGESRLPR